jgi:hypothetical protein
MAQALPANVAGDNALSVIVSISGICNSLKNFSAPCIPSERDTSLEIKRVRVYFMAGLIDCFWPIVLNKLIIQNCVTIDHRERHFCTLLREIRVWKPLPKLKISISDAYFSAVETMADFFNGIGRCLPVSMGWYQYSYELPAQRCDRSGHTLRSEDKICCSFGDDDARRHRVDIGN